jgi:hypothetical protein
MYTHINKKRRRTAVASQHTADQALALKKARDARRVRNLQWESRMADALIGNEVEHIQTMIANSIAATKTPRQLQKLVVACVQSWRLRRVWHRPVDELHFTTLLGVAATCPLSALRAFWTALPFGHVYDANRAQHATSGVGVYVLAMAADRYDNVAFLLQCGVVPHVLGPHSCPAMHRLLLEPRHELAYRMWHVQTKYAEGGARRRVPEDMMRHAGTNDAFQYVLERHPPIRDALVYGERAHQCAARGFGAALRLLVQHKMDVNAVSKFYGHSILYDATQCTGTAFPESNNAATMVRMLLDARADPNARAANAHWTATPLHQATSSGKSECVQLLLQAKASLAAPDNPRRCPYLSCVVDPASTRALLDAKASGAFKPGVNVAEAIACDTHYCMKYVVQRMVRDPSMDVDIVRQLVRRSRQDPALNPHRQELRHLALVLERLNGSGGHTRHWPVRTIVRDCVAPFLCRPPEDVQHARTELANTEAYCSGGWMQLRAGEVMRELV